MPQTAFFSLVLFNISRTDAAETLFQRYTRLIAAARFKPFKRARENPFSSTIIVGSMTFVERVKTELGSTGEFFFQLPKLMD